jgi:hypothetical protein
MEFLDGVTLKHLIADKALAIELADGLDARSDLRSDPQYVELCAKLVSRSKRETRSEFHTRLTVSRLESALTLHQQSWPLYLNWGPSYLSGGTV